MEIKNKFLLDTNILIYYFNGLVDEQFIDKVLIESFNISIISKIEFLSWHKLLENKILNKKAIDFVSNATIFELDERTANETIRIRQKFKIATPDAIIGATAVLHGFEIVTNNICDFEVLDVKIRSISLWTLLLAFP